VFGPSESPSPRCRARSAQVNELPPNLFEVDVDSGCVGGGRSTVGPGLGWTGLGWAGDPAWA
jgi:hypothetical protein